MRSNYEHEHLLFEVLLPGGQLTHVLSQREVENVNIARIVCQPLTRSCMRPCLTYDRVLLAARAIAHQWPTAERSCSKKVESDPQCYSWRFYFERCTNMHHTTRFSARNATDTQTLFSSFFPRFSPMGTPPHR